MRGCSCRGTAGFAHVSCLAEQAKILVAEAEENNLGDKAMEARWRRWETCSLCEQQYHGFVKCALGWACWKTYVGRPETDKLRMNAMSPLSSGLFSTDRIEDALRVDEANLSMLRRLGAYGPIILIVQSALAVTYSALGRTEQALSMERDVYYGRLKLNDDEHEETLRAANNYANSLVKLEHFKEAKSLLRKSIPVARRILGDSNVITIKMRVNFASALYEDASATLDDLRESVTTFEEIERIARRVMGGAHPLTEGIENDLRNARAALRARETLPSSGSA